MSAACLFADKLKKKHEGNAVIIPFPNNLLNSENKAASDRIAKNKQLVGKNNHATDNTTSK